MKHTAHDPLSWLDDELASLDDRELRRYLHVRDGAQGVRIEVDGR